MSPTREKIARFTGWTCGEDGIWRNAAGEAKHEDMIPFYDVDLVALHVIITGLSGDQHSDYSSELWDLVDARNEPKFRYIEAPADMKAKALCLAIDKWQSATEKGEEA